MSAGTFIDGLVPAKAITPANRARCQRLADAMVRELGLGPAFGYLPGERQLDVLSENGVTSLKPTYATPDDLSHDLQHALDGLRSRGTPRERLARLAAGTGSAGKAAPEVLAARGTDEAAPQPVFDRDYLPLVLKEIGGAERAVFVAMNRMGLTDYRPHPVRAIMDALAGATARGVQVTLLTRDAARPQGTAHAAALRAAAKAGAALTVLPAGAPFHHKLVVIDRTTVITGSHGWTLPSLAENAETSMVLRSPRLAEQALALATP
ncbi:MAG: hypothetical protein AcusKO_06760 [Acuticoccus sp.]